MSKQTKAALEDAIRAHIADVQPGTTIVAWELVSASIDNETNGDGVSHYWLEQADGQPLHVCEGLLRFGLRMVGNTWAGGGDE